MIRCRRVMACVLPLLAGWRLSAQAPNGSVRDMMVEDSLAPAKVQLRDFVVRLNDSLTAIQAVQARITRARASHMDAVVTSLGRDLGRKCTTSDSVVRWTANAVGYMHTNDSRGDRALASYVSSLNDLSADLATCRHDDSLTMTGKSVDLSRIQDIAAQASAAVDRYNGIRDALLHLLGIKLPAKGTIPIAH